MVIKRKRNLKVDATSLYSVLLLKELNPEELEDYVEDRDTGMEADEEKEIHLQNIIKGSGDKIPLPVIDIIENKSRKMYSKIKMNRRIEWSKDCKNIYVETGRDIELESELRLAKQMSPSAVIRSEIPDVVTDVGTDVAHDTLNDTLPSTIEDQNNLKIINNNLPNKNKQIFIENPQMTEFLTLAGDNKNVLSGKTEKLASFYLRRTLIRYERQGFEPYACFRDRIFHPTFKSRRNEALMIEKISRLGVEFSTLKKLCELNLQKSERELQVLRETLRIVKKANKMTQNKKKKISKMLYEGFSKKAQSKINFNIHSVMTDREKIITMKTFKQSSELFLDIKYYDIAMGILKREQKDK